MDAKVEFEHAADWYAQTAVSPKRWPSLAFELDVDVCVIGGGLAGLTTALEVARRGWSVAVLEARRIAWNASGRNLGFVLPGFAQDIDKIVERCGIDHAKILWALSEDGVEYIRNLIREAKIAQMYSAIQTGQSFGMQTLDQNLQELVKRNVVSVDEARTKAANKDNFK